MSVAITVRLALYTFSELSHQSWAFTYIPYTNQKVTSYIVANNTCQTAFIQFLIMHTATYVDLTNNTQYQCVFALFSGDVESSVGVLRILGNVGILLCTSNKKHLKCNRM